MPKLKGIKKYLFTAALSFSILFINDYLHIRQRNSSRKDALTNPIATEGEIISVSKPSYSRNIHYPGIEYFTFFANNNSYNGVTLYTYSGAVGDKICIIYNSKNPQFNICCHEQTLESVTGKNFIGYTFLTIMFLALIFISDLFTRAKKNKRDREKQTSI